MNLHKKCLNYHCHDYFPAKPLEFKFFCDKEKCQESSFYRMVSIKKSRHIPTNYFDIYDLDRSIKYNGKIVSYERVCRVCGAPLLNKDGKYSIHKRYCNEHNGSELWAKYNWGIVAKDYAWDVADKNKELIKEKLGLLNDKEKERVSNHGTVCENCSKICLVYDTSWNRKRKLGVINIHHKTPVHTLDKDNLHLIWEWDNLIALCEDCHKQQDHQLKTKVDPYIHFRKITEFLNGV